MGWTDVLSALGHGTGYFVPGVGAAADFFDAGRGAYSMMNPEQPQQQLQQQGLAGQSNTAGMQPQGNIAGDVAQVPLFNQGQQDFMSQMLGQLRSTMGQPGMGFGPIADQAKANFQEQTIPSILERLTGLQGEGLRSGSLGLAMGQAGAGLNRDLAAQQAQYNQGMFAPMMNMAMQPQNQTFFQPQGPSFLSSAGQGIASGVGQALPMGALLALMAYMNKQPKSQYAPVQSTQANMMRTAAAAQQR